MAINWRKMNQYLKPRIGSRFAVVNDYIENTVLLIDLKNKFVLMSDSNRERAFSTEFIEQARGDVLSIGFGIGFVIYPLIEKPEVKSLTIVEKYQEVLDLCASQLDIPDRVNIVHCDIYTYKPGKLFDVIFDDCTWSTDDGDQVWGGPYEIEMRLRKYLNPDGIYLKWRDDGRYRD